VAQIENFPTSVDELQNKLAQLNAENQLLRTENNQLRQQVYGPANASADASLLTSAQLLKAVFESSFYMLVVMDTDLYIRAVNEQAVQTQHFYFHRPMNIGDYAGDIVTKENREPIITQLNQVLQGETLRSEMRIVGKTDNKTYWFDIVMAPIYDSDRTIIGVCYGANNITEQKLAEERVEQLYMQEQMMSEELAAQNEELNQNLEELEATQDFLRMREERLEKLYNGTPSLMLSIDRQGQILGASDYWLEFFERDRSEVVGKNMLDLVLPESRAGLAKAWTQFIVTDRSHIPECLALKKNGTLVELAFLAASDLDEKRHWNGLVVVTDVSSKNQAARTALQTKEQLQNIFDSLDNVFWSYDTTNYKLLLLSPAFEKLFGYKTDIFIDSQEGHELFWQVISNEDRPRFDMVVQQCLTTGNAAVVDYQITTADGQTKWVQSNVKPYLNKQENILQLEGITTDITFRKEAELKLAESENNFRSIYEQAAAGIFQLDLAQNIIGVNKVFGNMLGHTRRTDAHRQPVLGLIHPEHHQEVSEALEKVVLGKEENLKLEARFLPKDDGQVVWLLITFSLVRHADLSPKYVLGIVQNISELKKVQQDLMFKNNELDTFVYRASHDLLGPIASLRGLSDIMSMEENSPTMAHYISLFKGSAKRLDTILQNLIELTKIKSAEISVQEVDVWPIIKEGIAAFANLPEFARVKILTEVRLTKPLFSDPRLLAVIFQNLIENGIKYSRNNISDGFMNILVEETSEEVVRIVVEDNGEGIPKMSLNKIFNMFFRATESSKGSGLGLYVLKNALDKLNGSVAVESELGRGSRFTVFLPSIQAG